MNLRAQGRPFEKSLLPSNLCDVEGEDPGVYRFTERGLLGFGFQGLDLRAKALVGFVMSPLGFGGQELVDRNTSADDAEERSLLNQQFSARRSVRECPPVTTPSPPPPLSAVNLVKRMGRGSLPTMIGSC